MSGQSIAIVAIYFGMLLFDAAIMAGCSYLVVKHQWSSWWMLAAVVICTGSNPKTTIRMLTGVAP